MSTISGHSTKGDKNKGKYTTININSIYKGTSTTPQQKSVTQRQHGLQSLGKVASARRMPPPAHLPSLRSENSGNDPNVNLVPTGGSGWGNKEKEGTPTSQPPSSQPTQVTVPSVGQNAQKPATTQAVPVTSTPPTNSSNNSSGSTSNNNGTTPGLGGKSWSSIAIGEQKRGGAFLDQQSATFREEFPKLSTGGEEKSTQPPNKTKEEPTAENKEAQYGPGPSLRPQNVGSWREGGGRGAAQLQQQQDKAEGEIPQNGQQMSGGSAEQPGSPEPAHPPANRPSPGMEQPSRPVMPMPYRGMPPPYMYGPGPGYARYPPPQFGMRPPYPFPTERFRGPPSLRPPTSESEERRTGIVKEGDLKKFDEIDEKDGGWAGEQVEIDYSEKLVFSDDEDGGQSRESKKSHDANRRRDDESGKEKWDNWEKTGRPDHDRSPKVDRDGEGREGDLPPGPREAWAMHMGPRGPGGFPPDAGRIAPWQRMPFEPRGAMPFMYRMRPPPPGQRMPFPGPQGHPHGQRPPQSDQDDDEMYRQNRQNHAEYNAAVERARQKREEGERRVEGERRHRTDSDTRSNEEKKDREKDDLREGESNRSRTTSEGSDKDRSGRHQPMQFSRQFARNVPPRFINKQSEGAPKPPTPDGTGEAREGGPGGPLRQGMRQGPPWAGYDPRGDPRAWPGFPPPWAMGGRPPMDMPPAMYEEMRRNMSHMPPYYDKRGMPDKDWERRESDRDSKEGDKDYEKKFDRHSSEEKSDLESRERSGSGRERNNSGFSDELPPRRIRERSRRDTDENEQQIQKDPFEDSHEGKHVSNRTPPRGNRERDFVSNRYGSRGRDENHYRQRSDRDHYKRDRDYGERDYYRYSDYKERTEESYEDVRKERPSDYHSEKRDRGNVDYRKEREIRRGDHEFKKESKSDVAKFDVRKDRGSEEIVKDVVDHSESKEDVQPSSKKDDVDEQQSYASSSKPKSREGMSSKPREDKSGPNRDRYEKSMDQPRQRRENVSAPPPIPAQQARENILPKSNLTSLKRTHSNMSSPGVERKSESPKEVTLSVKQDKAQSGESPIKDVIKKPVTVNVGSDSQKPTVQPTMPKETKEQDKENKPEQEKPQKTPQDKVQKKDPETNKKEGFKEKPKREDRPPHKRMKDEEQAQRRRSDEYREPRGRGGRGRASSREFVRGGRSSRGRSGYSSIRGRGGRGRPGEYYDGGAPRFTDSRDHHYSEGKKRSNKSVSNYNSFPDPENWEDPEPVDARRRTQDGDSEVSADETSVTHSESSGDRTSVPKEATTAVNGTQDANHGDSNREINKEEHKVDRRDRNRNDNRGNDNRGNDNRGNDNRGNDNRGRGRQYSEQSYWGYRQEGGRGRGSSYRGKNPRSNSTSGSSPWAEQPRRGRGNSSRGRGTRNFSAPPKNGGGLGRPQPRQAPPDSKYEEPAARGENKENKIPQSNTNRNESKRQERNQPAPRFSRSGFSGTRGRGFDRTSSRGRGRVRTHSRSQSDKRPALTKQNSSDPQNEEWETASESSDVLDRKDKEPSSDRDFKDHDHDHDGKDGGAPSSGGGGKKSFSRQRPSNDRQNRRNNSNDNRRSQGGERGGGRNFSKDKSPTSSKPTGQSSRPGGQGARSNNRGNSMRKENVNSVYSVTEVVHDDSTAIKNALNNISNKSRPKNGDLTDVSKPLKMEKDKKTDALANIDINNYASVVVIDDQPEVSIDDPAFLFESNDGFQEVTSKKSQKSKAKAAQEEALKLEQKKKNTEARKKESGNKSGKGGSARSSEKPGRMSKLPPRLAKQREQKDKGAQEQKSDNAGFMPKIENWDNEMANNIPTDTPLKEVTPTPAAGPCLVDVTPAPAPMVNAWDKRITITSGQQPLGAPGEKFDKGDHHDSGYASEPPNSATSSTRSSPSTEKKLQGPKHGSVVRKVDETRVLDFPTKHTNEAPKPQRQPRNFMNDDKVVKKPETKEKAQIVEPIQLPPSFNKDPIFKISKGEESSEIKLDFTFGEDLSCTLSDEKPMAVKEYEAPHQPMNLPEEVVHSVGIQSPTSPAADDLIQKLSSVKEFWDDSAAIQASASMTTIFENSVPAGPNYSIAEPGVPQNVPLTEAEVFNTFSPSSIEMSIQGNMTDDNGILELEPTLELQAPPVLPSATPSEDMIEAALSLEDSNASVKFIPQQSIGSMGSMGGKVSAEQKNVCTVKPQQQQPMTYGFVHAPLENIANIASPSPVYITNQSSQYLPFQLGSSQLVPQEPRFNQQQPSYNFGLNQQPQQTQPPQAPIGQTPISQSNLFLQATPAELFSSFRNQQQQAFGQNNQSTIMVSSATSTLMSAGVKPPGPNQFFGSSGQKGSTLGLQGAVPFGQILGSSAIQPSPQQLVLFDATVTPTSQPAQPQNVAAPAMANNQVIGGPIIHQRPPLQTQQPQTSFYSQNRQPRLQTTGFYQAQQQQSTTSLQGPIQQLTGPATFTLPGFNTQPQGVTGLPVQPIGAAMIGKAPAFRTQPVPTTPTTTPQMKLGENTATVSVSMGQVQALKTPKSVIPPPPMPVQSSVPPMVPKSPQQPHQPPQTLVHPQAAVIKLPSSNIAIQNGPKVNVKGPSPNSSFQARGPRPNVKAQQAKQREELIQAAKSFLNPENKPAPRVKKGENAEEIIEEVVPTAENSADN